MRSQERKDAARATGGPSDLKFVGMTFSPGPDANERLRRLTALLLRLTSDATPGNSVELTASDGDARFCEEN